MNQKKKISLLRDMYRFQVLPLKLPVWAQRSIEPLSDIFISVLADEQELRKEKLAKAEAAPSKP